MCCYLQKKEKRKIYIYIFTPSEFQILFIDAVNETRMVGGCGNSRHRGPALSTAAQVPSGENALQRPQHDDAEQHYQNEEEHKPPPIPVLILPAEALRRL